jgi:hypothetical protein
LTSKLSRNKGFLLFSLLLICGSAAADTQPQSADAILSVVRQELEQGKVNVVYRMSNREQGSEQYADWSAYLNYFASSKGKHYSFHSSDKGFDDFLKKNGADVGDDYTVFMKKGYVAYYYDGVILESMVYTSVDNAYAKKPLTDMDKAFLPEAIHIVVGE